MPGVCTAFDIQKKKKNLHKQSGHCDHSHQHKNHNDISLAALFKSEDVLAAPGWSQLRAAALFRQNSVKIAFPKSPPNLCTLEDRSLEEKAIIKRKPASEGSDFIMFPCCYFHHRLFSIPLFFFSFFSSFPSSCCLRSHLLGAHNDFYDNCAEEGSTGMQRELQWDRFVSGGTFLHPEAFSQF